MDALNAPTAQLVRDITTIGLEPKAIAGTTHLVVPPQFQHIDLTSKIEQAQIVPNRLRGTIALGSLESLLTYLADQHAQATGYVYADPDARTITAVFNDMKAGPGWRDHRAVF